MKLIPFITTLHYVYIIVCPNIAGIKLHKQYSPFTRNPIAGKLPCIPVFSIVHESGHPLILSRGSEHFTLSFSNPSDAISLLTELIQSESSDKRPRSWKIKAISLDSWLSKLKDDKKFSLKHKLIHSSLNDKLNNVNKFEVYYVNNLTTDGKILVFFDLSDLQDEIKSCTDESKREELYNNIQSMCLMDLITDDSKLENYFFVPSKRALKYLTSRRI